MARGNKDFLAEAGSGDPLEEVVADMEEEEDDDEVVEVVVIDDGEEMVEDVEEEEEWKDEEEEEDAEEGEEGWVEEEDEGEKIHEEEDWVEEEDEHQPVNGLSKVDNSIQALPTQGDQVTGAKKRKSGSVRRFKQDEAMQEEETVDRNKGGDYANAMHITKVIKPVHYIATVTDDVQQVSVLFKALRSDGQEVLVDNKELKANDPSVLIKFYEQNLRYIPPLLVK